jgi:alkylation response protein AidB-like acyl-CoA dehydrogenase
VLEFCKIDISTAFKDAPRTREGFDAARMKLQGIAKEKGLWNFFLPEVSGLSVLEYAPIAEILGRYGASLYMNCSAPDTGNMEVLEKYGNAAQKKEWLEPLLNGEIRSAFAMTEPAVASSDASQICSTIRRDANEYVINGHKWFISGAWRESCKVFIFLGQTRGDGPLHARQSMIIVPRNSPGVKMIRTLDVFGHKGDHAEIFFHNVRVPVTNMILGEGRGFEIAQGRLGPGRIHHCMRTIGSTEDALASIVYRAKNRTAFGGHLIEKDTIRQVIAEAQLDITMTRQLCYLAATIADERGFKEAKRYIAMIKVQAPRMALRILDEAIQAHGAHGVSQVSKLSAAYTGMRTLRVADGPDIVHLNTIAKDVINNSSEEFLKRGQRLSGVNPYIAQFKEEQAKL